MSDRLTRAIRALRDSPRRGPVSIPATAGEAQDPPVLCAGALAPPKRARRDSLPATEGERIWTEQSRESEVVRITATDGSGAWLDVERPTRIRFQDAEGYRMTLVLKP